MPFPRTIDITAIADDMIYLYIPDDTFIGTRFQYEICDCENKIFRKGYFLGIRVQIRVADLRDGNYFFNIRTDAANESSFKFEKISGIKNIMRDQKFVCD